MVVSARPDEPDPDPVGEVRKHGPDWAGVQLAMMASAEACALACAELAANPHHGAAKAMVQLTRSLLERLGDVARQRQFNDEVLEAERAAAFAAGMAACKAARCRLSVVDEAS